MTFMNC